MHGLHWLELGMDAAFNGLGREFEMNRERLAFPEN
jgi:hypothetical protein